MKSSQTFLYDSKTGNIQYIDKAQFIKELSGIISKKQNKVIDLKDIKKLSSLTYKDIIKQYSKDFSKLSTGIYGIKTNSFNIISLLEKTTEDFEKHAREETCNLLKKG